jgi:hypothetical protein
MADEVPNNSDITRLLIAWGDGRREALDDLMPIVSADLRRVAAGYMRREAPGHALQPTALVHEAFVRLVDQKQVKWRNRAHFYGVAAGMIQCYLLPRLQVPQFDACVVVAADTAFGAWMISSSSTLASPMSRRRRFGSFSRQR